MDLKKAIILGTGNFADGIYYFLKQEDDIEICGFTVDSKYRCGDTYDGLPLVDYETVEDVFPPNEYGIYICIGYIKMCMLRERMFNQALDKGYEILSYIHPTAVVNAKSMGIGTMILENVTIGPDCEIGNGNVFRANAHLAHNAHVGDFNYFTISVSLAGRMNIGNHCFFGNNCTVKDGLKISDFTLVGAGCYVSKDTEPYGVYVPARSVHLADKKSTDMF